jgi:hypothetical protein
VTSGLSGRCEVGNDPFFGGSDTPDRISSQRIMELKHELRVSVGGDRTIAVGSFNFHNDLPSSASSGWTSGNGRPPFATRRRR